MFSLDGRTALITGASGGIGAEIAKALHAQGAHVILTGTRQDALDAVAAACPGRATVMTCNLGDADAVAGLIDAATEKAGANVDILVNNAGITRDGLMMRMKDEDWDAVMDINLKAAMVLSRASMRAMMKARWGRIIQISRSSAIQAIPVRPIMLPPRLA